MEAAAMKVVSLAVSLVLILTYAHADTGTATFYTPPYVPSACFGLEEQGTMIAAASEGIYNNGASCGRMYRVTCTGPTNLGVPQPCTGNTVTVKVVDLCPSPGCQATIDLSQEAFSSIANPDAGKINIEFTE
ncbi:EG45-like domain containing protein isoform X2 [Cucurbita maxima]|nr:EG45-like domain containing protein isoform X2 [Cucurbita maxima]